MVFFGLVYVVGGIGQTGCLIAQALNFYLKQALGWTPVQVTALGRLRLCPFDVDHQFIGRTLGQYRLVPLRARIPAAFTALAFVLVPLLCLHDGRPGEPAPLSKLAALSPTRERCPSAGSRNNARSRQGS
jgi:hypothetical protein